MSRRLLLAAAGATAGIIPDPLPGGGGEVEPPESLWAGWAVETDPVLLNLRPHGRRVAMRSVGITGATDTDLSDAATAAKGEIATFGQGTSLAWNGAGPDYRYDVLIGAGTYPAMGGGEWGCYVGTTGNAADVLLTSGLGNNGTLNSFGSQYLESLTLRAFTADDISSPKYPWHITGGPVTVASNVVFDASDAISGAGDRTAGLVGKDNSTLTMFYKCTFIGNPGVVDGFNMHGGLPKPLPETMIFADCTFIGMESVSGTGARAVNGDPSRLYVIGCTFDAAMQFIDADADTEVYTDTALTVTGAAATYRGVTTWPTITDGLTVELGAYYYPSALGDEPSTHTITVTDTAPMAPVVGRAYITLVKMDAAARVTTSGVTCTTAAGQLQLRHYPATTPEDVDTEGPVKDLTPDQTVTVGSNSWEHLYAYTRYPGSKGIWASVEFSDTAARVNGSAELAGLTECYTCDDGTTLVPVTAGTPHPVPFLRAT